MADPDQRWWDRLERVGSWFCGCPDVPTARRKLKRLGCDKRTEDEIINLWLEQQPGTQENPSAE